MFSLYRIIQLIAYNPALPLAIKEKVKKVICKTVKSHLSWGLTAANVVKYLRNPNFQPCFLPAAADFRFRNRFLNCWRRPKSRRKKTPPQQRVVDVPPAYVGVAIQYVQERDGRAAQPPQVDHAFVGAQRPGVESHAVDVDQLETVAACRTVVFPEDIGLVEILVADPLLMEADGEAGEGFEYGQRVGAGNCFMVCGSGVSSDRRETK